MPIYEYRCSSCTYRFEILSSTMNPNETETCPECGDMSLRVFSAPAQVKLEGAGFYANDYPTKPRTDKID